MAGLRAYAAIDQTVVLTQIIHQQDNSPEAVQFRNVLKELRQGTISSSSWQLLVRRTKDNLSPAEWESFHDALRLYATSREVVRYNLQHLESLNRPVMNVKAVNTGPSQEGVGNLENELLLSVGAKVMLLWNLCLDEGVVNGTRATVHSLIWHDDVQDAFNTLPAMVLVKIDGYAGRASVPINGEQLVPILPRMQQWDHNGSVCSRRQIPLTLAFAITIHKSQGLTLDKAVVNLDTKRILSNFTYVALSRVRHPNSLALEGIAPFDRFSKNISLSVKLQQNDARRRLGQSI